MTLRFSTIIYKKVNLKNTHIGLSWIWKSENLKKKSDFFFYIVVNPEVVYYQPSVELGRQNLPEIWKWNPFTVTALSRFPINFNRYLNGWNTLSQQKVSACFITLLSLICLSAESCNLCQCRHPKTQSNYTINQMGTDHFPKIRSC